MCIPHTGRVVLENGEPPIAQTLKKTNEKRRADSPPGDQRATTGRGAWLDPLKPTHRDRDLRECRELLPQTTSTTSTTNTARPPRLLLVLLVLLVLVQLSHLHNLFDGFLNALRALTENSKPL